MLFTVKKPISTAWMKYNRWLMQEWLAGFAFRIAINLWVFVFSGLIALFVALVTVSYQTIRTSMINPVNTLRNE